MSLVFLILALFTVGAALAAVTLRDVVHCVLCVALSFTGIAMLFLQLGAEFAGWAQVLVYVGAVAILIVFAILLTGGGHGRSGERVLGRSWGLGLLVVLAVFAAIVMAFLNSPSLARPPSGEPALAVKELGAQLMSTYVLPLEVLGLLLTAAMIGAAIIALEEKGRGDDTRKPNGHN
jgi:NADH:ubiquinone oxidoreductase subunit 6 (subunit J)